MKSATYRVIIEADAEGYHAYVPALKGCHTWAKTIPKTREMIRDAIDVYLRSLVADKQPIPRDEGFELFETVLTPQRAIHA